MAIFHSCVKLPEGKSTVNGHIFSYVVEIIEATDIKRTDPCGSFLTVGQYGFTKKDDMLLSPTFSHRLLGLHQGRLNSPHSHEESSG